MKSEVEHAPLSQPDLDGKLWQIALKMHVAVTSSQMPLLNTEGASKVLTDAAQMMMGHLREAYELGVAELSEHTPRPQRCQGMAGECELPRGHKDACACNIPKEHRWDVGEVEHAPRQDARKFAEKVWGELINLSGIAGDNFEPELLVLTQRFLDWQAEHAPRPQLDMGICDYHDAAVSDKYRDLHRKGNFCTNWRSVGEVEHSPQSKQPINLEMLEALEDVAGYDRTLAFAPMMDKVRAAIKKARAELRGKESNLAAVLQEVIDECTVCGSPSLGLVDKANAALEKYRAELGDTKPDFLNSDFTK